MNIITISREYGSGGRELGKYIAQVGTTITTKKSFPLLPPIQAWTKTT